jgi:hypothetical protein
MLVEQILRLEACTLTEPELLDLCDRCTRIFPFAERMKTLLTRVGTQCASLGLKKPGLWQRLAFEYWVFDALPQNDIGLRTDPAAVLAGTRVTRGQLNVWLSNGRLVRRIAEYLRMEQDR